MSFRDTIEGKVSKPIDADELKAVLASLAFEGSDNQRYEVKAAKDGFPESTANTLCAFANTPDGGVMIFGVDETSNFKIVGVYNAKACQQSIANLAKNSFNNHLELSIELVEVDDKKIVWVEVFEADRQLKPIELKKTKRSFIRLYDGDFELSDQEKQLFITARGMSRSDEEPVDGTSKADLDKSLVEAFIQSRKDQSSTIARMSDDEILLRTGIIDPSGLLTKAGLLALGVYPQQYFPNYTIKASVQKRSKNSNAVLAINVRSFDGPISTMLSEAVQWVKDNCDELTLNMPSGHVRVVHEYPVAVMRELIANALIHRALGSISMSQDISLIIEDDRLILSNPGGLYGVHVNELGRTGSVTRNGRLADICQYVHGADGVNIIEKLGSGIPMVFAELTELGLPLPRFIDGGIYFTVILTSITAASHEAYEQHEVQKVSETQEQRLTQSLAEKSPSADNSELIIWALKEKPLSRAELERATELTNGQVRYSLKKLIASGEVSRTGQEKSPTTKYTLPGT